MRKLIPLITVALACCLAPAGSAAAAPGQLAPGFGNGGIASVDPAPDTLTGWYALDAAGAPDGSSYVLETAQDCKSGGENPPCTHQVSVARYTSAGAIDPTYGSGGFASVSEGAEAAGGNALAVDLEGRALVVRATTGSPNRMVLTRLDSAGRPDPSFGVGGRVTLSCTCFYETPDLHVDRDGRIVLVGPRTDLAFGRSTYEVVDIVTSVTRLQSNGALDSSFGKGGTASITGFQSSIAAVRGNGSIVIRAFARGKGSSVVRVSANGRGVDRQFNVSKRLRGRWLYEFIALPKNRVAILGTQTGGLQSFVARLRGDGSIDPKYRNNGIAEPNFMVSSAAADRHGRILMAGTVGEEGTTARDTGVVRRLLADGKADRGFVNGLAGIGSVRGGMKPFYGGSRPMVFQTSSGENGCRFYCRPYPSLFRLKG